MKQLIIIIILITLVADKVDCIKMRFKAKWLLLSENMNYDFSTQIPIVDTYISLHLYKKYGI